MSGDIATLEMLRQINDRLETIRKEGSDRGESIWQKINDLEKQQVRIDERLKSVESSVNTAHQTTVKVKEMQDKAAGAGWLGAKLMLIGGFLLSTAAALYAVRDSIIHWVKILMR